MHFAAVSDYKVTDAIEEPALSVDMKPLDGLILAIKKELHAAQMYTRLDDIYTNMAYPEAW